MTRRSLKNKRQEANREYRYTNSDFAQIMENTAKSNIRQLALWGIPYGAKRRQALLKLLSEPGESLHVNRKWCPLLKHDTDLVKLLKAGKLVRSREGARSTHYTVLRIPA